MNTRTSRPFVADDICPEPLQGMLETIQTKNYAIDGIAAVKDGALKLDLAFHPFGTGDLHRIYSCTKSILSTLIGIAIHQGKIDGPETPIGVFLPERLASQISAEKQAITIGQLLTMTAGLDIHDHGEDFQDFFSGIGSKTLLAHILEQPFYCRPGAQFRYNNSGSHLACYALQEATGMAPADFAQAHLFEPLGITNFFWSSHPESGNTGWSGIRLSTADLARFGALFASSGRHQDRQLVPEDWMRVATQPHVPADPHGHYGFHWWTQAEQFHAAGFFGQYLFVRPSEGVAVAINSSLAPGCFLIPQYLLERFILPALRTTGMPDQLERARLRSMTIKAAKADRSDTYAWRDTSEGQVSDGVFRRTQRPALSFNCPLRSTAEEIHSPNRIGALRMFEGSRILISLRGSPPGSHVSDAASHLADRLMQKTNITQVSVTSNTPFSLASGHSSYRSEIRYRFDNRQSCTAVVVSAFQDGVWVCLEGHTAGDPDDIAPFIESLTFDA